MIKLFAVDMDGTCLDSRSRISDETLFWLKRAKEHGVEIVPTTGRALSCLPHQLKGQDLFRYVITSNGAMVTDLKEKKTLFQALIPLPAALSLIRDCQGPGVGLTAHIRHRYLLEGRVLALLGHLTYGQDAGEARAVRSLLHYTEAKKCDVEELQFFFFSEKARRRTQQILQSCPEISAAYTDHYVEIYSRNASKGKALAAAAAHLSIAREQIASIGDGENDISMFRQSGLCFAMGNGVSQLKEMADQVVSSNDRDGVAEAIRYFLQAGL
ncbi:MAG TPA: HAD family hydrolase [Candidatus Blautia gallistercoris]|uniref:HAD family hydrolase n=1 Tax=Candidatus Blautia gallistercoris TaxID=2838490 RepID=A0A9D1WGG7_9FIRM|nr:HAD family hydrolase [Candidatus Blautia gallistercoris]